MVLIIIKKLVKRVDIIFVPKKPLFDFLDSHVARKDCQGKMSTCLVDERQNWTGKPPYNLIISLLTETLKKKELRIGENHYNIPHHFLQNSIKCREFTDCVPYSNAFEGDFILSIVRADPRAPGGINGSLNCYEKINPGEQNKIQRTIHKYSKNSIRLIIVRHLHPGHHK